MEGGVTTATLCLSLQQSPSSNCQLNFTESLARKLCKTTSPGPKKHGKALGTTRRKTTHLSEQAGPNQRGCSHLSEAERGEQGSQVPFPAQPSSGLCRAGGSPKPALHMPRWSTREKKREESSHRRCFSPSSPCWDVTLRERLLVPLAQLIPAPWEQHGTDRGRATVGSGNTVPPAQGHRNAGS